MQEEAEIVTFLDEKPMKKAVQEYEQLIKTALIKSDEKINLLGNDIDLKIANYISSIDKKVCGVEKRISNFEGHIKTIHDVTDSIQTDAEQIHEDRKLISKYAKIVTHRETIDLVIVLMLLLMSGANIYMSSRAMTAARNADWRIQQGVYDKTGNSVIDGSVSFERALAEKRKKNI